MSRPIRNTIARTLLFAFACACLVRISDLAGAQNPPPQPKFTVTKEASDKFGKGGSVEIKSDDKLRVHSETWRDQDGKIIEEHEIVYDEKGIKSESWSFPGQWKFIKEKYFFSDEPWDGKWSLYAEKQGEEKVPEEEKTDDVTLENDQPADVVGKKVEEFEQQFNRLGAIEYVKSIRDKEKPPEKPQPKETDPSKPGYDPTEQGTLPTKEVFTPSKKPNTEPSTPPTKTNGDSSLTEPSTTAEVVDAKVPGYSATIKTPPGLFTTVMTTPSKDVFEIYLPRDMVAGETVLGSTKLTPAKPSGLSVPISFQIGLGDYIEVWNRPFTVKLDDQPLTRLRLLDQKKKPLTEVDFHTSQKPMRLTDFSIPSNGTGLEDFYLPTAGTFGNLLPIQAKDLIKFDDFLKPNSGVFIGNQPMPIIAATPHEIITRVDYEKPGPTEIEIKLGPFTFKKSFRVLKLDLAADKLNLLKFESTNVHITVHGLQKLRAPAHMKIAVSGAVKMVGESEVVIPPAEISADGTYSTTRVLEAGEPGPFGMIVTVTVDKEP